MTLPAQLGLWTLRIGLLALPAKYLTDATIAIFSPKMWTHSLGYATFVQRLMTTGTILFFGLALYAVALICNRSEDDQHDSPETHWTKTVITLLILGPPIYFAAHCLTILIKISIVGSWQSEGSIFLQGFWYVNMYRLLFPYVVVGLIIAAWDMAKTRRAEQGARVVREPRSGSRAPQP